MRTNTSLRTVQQCAKLYHRSPRIDVNMITPGKQRSVCHNRTHQFYDALLQTSGIYDQLSAAGMQDFQEDPTVKFLTMLIDRIDNLEASIDAMLKTHTDWTIDKLKVDKKSQKLGLVRNLIERALVKGEDHYGLPEDFTLDPETKQDLRARGLEIWETRSALGTSRYRISWDNHDPKQHTHGYKNMTIWRPVA